MTRLRQKRVLQVVWCEGRGETGGGKNQRCGMDYIANR